MAKFKDELEKSQNFEMDKKKMVKIKHEYEKI